jgi:hypothetical protein
MEEYKEPTVDEIIQNLGSNNMSPEMQVAKQEGEKLAKELQDTLGIDTTRNVFDKEPEFDINDLLYRYREPKVKPCSVCGAERWRMGLTRADPLGTELHYLYVCSAVAGKRNSEKEHLEESEIEVRDDHEELREALKYLEQVVKAEYVQDVQADDYD